MPEAAAVQDGGMDLEEHWNEAYRSRSESVSWFEASPTVSLALLEGFASQRSGLIDVGSGASWLVKRLAEAGWRDLTALDVSSSALAMLRSGLGDYEDDVTFVTSDIQSFIPDRQYKVWHDRAVLHFLVDHYDREHYAKTVADSLGPGAIAIIGGFSPDGPSQCSGLAVCRASSEDIAFLLGGGFQVLFASESVHVTPQGIDQAFSWTVLLRLNDGEIASVEP